MKLDLRYTAQAVDTIEKLKGMPIANCINDASINNLVIFVQQGLNYEKTMTKNMAYDVIDDYLQENDTNELLFDIIEALVNSGFLARELEVKKLREQSKKEILEAMSQIK